MLHTAHEPGTSRISAGRLFGRQRGQDRDRVGAVGRPERQRPGFEQPPRANCRGTRPSVCSAGASGTVPGRYARSSSGTSRSRASARPPPRDPLRGSRRDQPGTCRRGDRPWGHHEQHGGEQAFNLLARYGTPSSRATRARARRRSAAAGGRARGRWAAADLPRPRRGSARPRATARRACQHVEPRSKR